MSYFNFTKIKVNYDFDGHKISTEVLPYKTIKHLKDIARTIFFSLNSDFKLFYGQKDLSLYENELIPEFFKNKSIISLKIFPIKKKFNKNKSQKLKQLVYSSNSNSNTNLLNNSTNVNNNLDIYNTINFNNNSSKKIKNYKIKNLFKREQLKCEECKNEIISNFCRICKKFICNECRITLHELHKVSQIDSDNLVESSKLYAFTLQREILTNFKITKFYNNKINTKNQIFTRKDKIADLLNEIDNKYEKILKDINLDLNNNNDDNDNQDFINNMLNQYEIKSKETNEEIDNIINEIYVNFTKQRKKMTVETFKEYFSILNEKDEEISLMSSDLYKYKINFEIIEKINNMYDKIEKIINDVLNNKHIFGVDDETHKMYKMIKKQNQNNNNNNIREDEEDEEEKNAGKGKMRFKKRYVIDANKKKNDNNNNNDGDLNYKEDEDVENNKNIDDNNDNNDDNNNENENQQNEEERRDEERYNNSEYSNYNENNNNEDKKNDESEENKNIENINDNSNINIINNNQVDMDNNDNLNIQSNVQNLNNDDKHSFEENDNNNDNGNDNNENKDQIFFEKEEMEDNNIVKN